jgi:hypothetical protein
LLRHAFVEVPVSVVKIEMLEKVFSTQQWVYGFFIGDKLYDKKIYI